MKILHIAPSFYPATYWGGPIWSTKAICDGIAARPGFDVQVLTTDAASPIATDRVRPVPLDYPVDYTRRVTGHSVAPGLLRKLPAAIGWADVVHLTATYNFPTLPTLALARVMGRPVVWSPRGALQATADWRDAPRKHHKHLFERAAHLLRPANTVLHATCAEEAAQSTARLGNITTAMIPNCVEIPTEAPQRTPDGQIRLLFLSRLHPKKGLDRLIAAMKTLPDHIHLDIYGTGEPDYVDHLISAVTGVPRIRLHGHVQGAAKAQAFANADLFVLPSHSENFGIAAAEALAYGLPVITTTGTPWQALDRQDCGRCIALSNNDLTAQIGALAGQDLAAMGAKGRAWMQRDFSPNAMVDQFAALYHRLSLAEPEGLPA